MSLAALNAAPDASSGVSCDLAEMSSVTVPTTRGHTTSRLVAKR